MVADRADLLDQQHAGDREIAAGLVRRDVPLELLRIRDVFFTPRSDDLAVSIRVGGVGCRYARDFIRDSNGRPARRYRGFTCGRRSVDRPDTLPHTRYRCGRATRVIFWKRF